VLLAVVAFAVAGFVSYRHARATEVAVESIAVIPFVNQDNNANAEWISDGLTESIATHYARLGDKEQTLRVASKEPGGA